MAIDVDKELLHQSSMLATLVQGQKDLSERLFNGGSGAIPTLTQANRDREREHKELVAQIAEHRQKDTWRHSITGTASMACGLLLKLGLSKLGIHF